MMRNVAAALMILGGALSHGAAQDQEASALAGRIEAGAINVTVDTLVTDQPLLYFAQGYVEAAISGCRYPNDLVLARDMLKLNQVLFFPLRYLAFHDETGRRDRTRDLGVLGLRAARWGAMNRANEAAYKPAGSTFFKTMLAAAGCSAQVRRFFDNAYAIVSIGRLPHVSDGSFKPSFYRKRQEPGDVTMTCFHRRPEDDRYSVRQEHVAATRANRADLGMGSASPLVHSLGYVPFVRGDCPAQLDPFEDIHRGELAEKESPTGAGPLAEQTALRGKPTR